MSDDTPFLRELAESLQDSQSDDERPQAGGTEEAGYVLILAEALDHALEVVGRTGRDSLYRVIEKSFDLRKEDVARRPGQYMSALRSLLGESCRSIETYMLEHIEQRTGVRGHSLEQAVEMLREADKNGG